MEILTLLPQGMWVVAAVPAAIILGIGVGNLVKQWRSHASKLLSGISILGSIPLVLCPLAYTESWLYVGAAIAELWGFLIACAMVTIAGREYDRLKLLTATEVCMRAILEQARKPAAECYGQLAEILTRANRSTEERLGLIDELVASIAENSAT